ncbi:hypothetical protein MNL04_06720 [Bartonella krasnovii]|uniref:hypothetical protein n=1 Tax=Bartonella krasnovii TaxID=2267275 RepID=UPI001F4CF717|nr:hypothetical protein [Bartonella krasnovii]UNF48385.1 hypothetical protein MNL04_06720 [Bartonella krasnovii]
MGHAPPQHNNPSHPQERITHHAHPPNSLPAPPHFLKKHALYKTLIRNTPTLKTNKAPPHGAQQFQANPPPSRLRRQRQMCIRDRSSSKPPLFPKKTENGQAIFFKKRETNDTLF